MNRLVRVRPQQERGLVHLYLETDPSVPLGEYEPDYTFTRIWMGVAPPEGDTPGYGCVVGEVHTPTALWDESHYVLLDEAVALAPVDFTTDEQERFAITAEANRHPTQEDLRRALIALKDLYRPDMLWAAPDPHFVQFLRRSEGLSWYDERLKSIWARRFPCLPRRYYTRSEGKVIRQDYIPPVPHTVAVVGDGDTTPPEDREYGILEIQGVVAQRRLTVQRYERALSDDDDRLVPLPSIFREHRERWPAIYRALSWVIQAMRYHPQHAIPTNTLVGETDYI